LARLLALVFLLPSEVFRPAPAIPPAGLRVLVLERNDQDPVEWEEIRKAGANVVATLRPPSRETDELAGAAGLTYLAFFTTDEIFTFAHDAAQIAEARSERNLAGFYFWDAQVVEGFTTPRAQEQAYSTLKLLFPDKLVLYPTRLDPIAWDPRFLDDYFRPQFTDLVTPYFYPVGTTIIGEAGEDDPWRLDELLSALAERVPAGKDILPVLQGFEQVGYPVGTAFLQKQFAIYRHHWPTLRNVAVYAWRFGGEGAGPLLEIAGRPDLEQGVCNLFRSLSRTGGCRSDREIPFR
ncbi:MAG TPA: hypothetical protein VFW15_10085, partial [Thermoanaerobaculia bacterium]|nr:hypothetical protein [Thermoanaerobaculia bacterium]